MPYSEELTGRIRDCLAGDREIVERRLFGGLGFLSRGNLMVCVWHDSLIVRLGPDQEVAALAEKHVGPFDVTGKPMRGWVMVAPPGLETDAQLKNWMEQARSFVATLLEK